MEPRTMVAYGLIVLMALIIGLGVYMLANQKQRRSKRGHGRYRFRGKRKGSEDPP